MYDYGHSKRPSSFGYTGLASPAGGSDHMNTGMSSVPMSFALDYLNQGSQPSSPLSTGVDVGLGSLDIMGTPGAQSAFSTVQDMNPGGLFNMPDWLNWGNAEKVLGGIGAIGQIYAGIQQNKVMKEALAFKKKSYAENMDYQRSTYNTSLTDRTRARASFTGQSAADQESYLNKHRLKG